MKHIRKSNKNIHSHLLVTDMDTDTDTKKIENGYGYGYKKIWERIRIRIRIQKNLRADTDTDTDTVLIIFTDIVSVDGYLYPSDPGFYEKVCSWNYLVTKIQHKHTSFKKVIRQITRVVFSTLDHVLRICRTCCNYFLCSSDPGEYNGHN